MHITELISRRKMILQSTKVIGAFALIPLTAYSPRVIAGPMSKASLHYQENPMDGKMCADCSAYTSKASLLASDSDIGMCKIVAGSVNPHGWCVAFSQR